MDDNVVDFGSYKEQKPKIVWECSCGEQLFYIVQETGAAECRSCGQVVYFAYGDGREEDEE